jgi:hypothetical protein
MVPTMEDDLDPEILATICSNKGSRTAAQFTELPWLGKIGKLTNGKKHSKE